MYERFPDAVGVLGSHGRGGSLRVGAMGFESGTQLILYMNVHGRNVYANIECVDAEEPRVVVDGLFAVEYIRITDCPERAPWRPRLAPGCAIVRHRHSPHRPPDLARR